MNVMDSKALTVLRELMSRKSALEIDWEGVLAKQYTALLKQPRVIVDVGAHRGTHTFHFINIGAARVVCFEPIPGLASDLRLLLDKYPVAELHNVALSDTAGVCSFTHNLTAPGESGLKERVASAPGLHQREIIEVDVQTLDSFNLTQVDFIKIDCEGAELRILVGADETIRQNRPHISLEYGFDGYSAYGAKKEDLWNWAKINRYLVCDLFGNSFDELSTYKCCVDTYYWDFFLIPVENVSESTELLRKQTPASLIP